MKAFAICSRGTEEAVEREIKRILENSETSKDEGIVEFSAKNIEEIYLFAYRTQSAKRILILIEKQPAENLDFSKVKFSEIYSDEKTFAARAESINKDFYPQDMEEGLGGEIKQQTSKSVNLNSPDYTFFAFANQKNIYMGIDISGDLSKRAYKIYPGKKSLKGNIAYSIISDAGFTGSEKILEDFVETGEMSIEAALLKTGKSPKFFEKDFFRKNPFSQIDTDKIAESADRIISSAGEHEIFAISKNFHSLRAAENNAKISGANKAIKFSRIDDEWLDLKFEAQEIDFAFAFGPVISKNISPTKYEKIYSEFFSQMKVIIKKKGAVAVIQTDSSGEETLFGCAEKNGFKNRRLREYFQGKMLLRVHFFKK